jgi:anti-sigma B factor antagonist
MIWKKRVGHFMDLTIDVIKSEKDVKVTVLGEIDAFTAPQLREKLFPLSDTKEVNMVVDLSGVTYLDSTGLGVFVGLFKNIRGKEGTFKIIGLSQRLNRLFHITGLADIMEIQSRIEGEL